MKRKNGVSLSGVVSYLDRELRVKAIQDSSNNGLQVQNSGKVVRVCCGVDASLEFFEAAGERKADLLIVHHGISWDDSLQRITRLNYLRLKFLMDHDMALYGCHLPLDAHERYGNNVLICKALGLKGLEPFGVYRGTKIGMIGSVAGGESYIRFRKRVEAAFGRKLIEMNFGSSKVSRVAVVSGGGCGSLSEAEEAGADMFVSGEPTLAGRNLLKDSGMNALFGGHYVTERFGVEALAGVMRRKFGVQAEFINLGIKD